MIQMLLTDAVYIGIGNQHSAYDNYSRNQNIK